MQAQLGPASRHLHAASFSAPWWLRNAHLQTIFAKYLSPKQQVPTYPEMLALPDGDELQLNWTEQLPATEQRPLLVILHGLAGDLHSHYIQGLLAEVTRRKLPAVVMHFRGCHGKPNKLPRAYHSGDTADVGYLLSQLQQRFPAMPLTAVGFSLGGNVLVKYCGEQASANPLRAAVAICPPLDLAACAKRINQGLSKIYQRYLLERLKRQTLAKLAQFPDFPLPLTPAQVQQFSSIAEFDQYYTAPIHGFRDAADYYQRASGKAWLTAITIPTLIIHASDDPFLSDAVIPSPTELSPQVEYRLSRHGGHVGFVGGKHPFRTEFWLNQQICDYLQLKLSMAPT